MLFRSSLLASLDANGTILVTMGLEIFPSGDSAVSFTQLLLNVMNRSDAHKLDFPMLEEVGVTS